MRYFSFRNILVILFIILFILSLKFIDGYFGVPVKSYVEQKAYIFTNNLLERTIRENVLNDLNPDDIIDIRTRGNDTIIVNTYQTNKIMSEVMNSVNDQIDNLNKDNYTLKLPLFMIFSDTLFLNYGPKVSIYLQPLSSTKVDVVSRLTEFGINNTLLEVVLTTEVRFQTLIPFQKDELVVTNEIPLLIEVITGEIPKYYYKGGSTIPLTPQDNNDSSPDTDLDMSEIPDVDT